MKTEGTIGNGESDEHFEERVERSACCEVARVRWWRRDR